MTWQDMKWLSDCMNGWMNEMTCTADWMSEWMKWNRQVTWMIEYLHLRIHMLPDSFTPQLGPTTWWWGWHDDMVDTTANSWPSVTAPHTRQRSAAHCPTDPGPPATASPPHRPTDPARRPSSPPAHRPTGPPPAHTGSPAQAHWPATATARKKKVFTRKNNPYE